jgi:hypothetical protein
VLREGTITNKESGKKEFFTLDQFKAIIIDFYNGEIYKAMKDAIKDEPLSILTNIKNKEGNNLPTVSIYNLISAYQRVIADASQREFGKRNLLTKNKNLIKYFEISEELELEDGSVSTFSFNGEENFSLFFTRHFLSAMVNPDLSGNTKLLVQP